MGRIIYTFSLVLVISSLITLTQCNEPQTKDSGIYQLAYISVNNEIQSFSNKLLVDFSRDSIVIVYVGDLATGELEKVVVEKMIRSTSESESQIYILGDKYILSSVQGDSVIFKSPEDSKTYAVLKRLKEEWRWKGRMDNCFNGAYVLSSDTYQDSICFINQSTLIYTGDNQMNFPVARWNLIHYKGFQLLNIQDEFAPLLVIQSCALGKATLHTRMPKDQVFEMKANPSDRHKTKLFGKWKEYRNKDAQPPRVDKFGKEILIELNIDKDSLLWDDTPREWKRKWNLTGDGKRIYFIDHLFDEDGSWKIYHLDDQKMILRLSEYNGVEERFMYFARVSQRND
ncbi:MAG: hypothetical protein HYZ44_11670 [Bacteroidetes bacterium]|nr:hypothetical protein [Bacteroidota bacterium]